MMIVSCYVGPSEIEGVGVFAAEAIKAGQPIWRLDERFDLKLTESEIAELAPPMREYVERYGYPHMTEPGFTVVEFDHGKFMNHTDAPNTDFRDAYTGYAIRDIAPGEELTTNYAEFDPGFVMQPGRQFVGRPHLNGHANEGFVGSVAA